MNIKLIIEFSIELEIKRVTSTLAKMDWYKSNGYNPLLPANLKDIGTSVRDEHEEVIFKKVSSKIEDQWLVYGHDLPIKFQELGLKYQNNYHIQLTKYGVKGSYNLPNLIILNIKERKIQDIIRTVIHEIIHLSIEDLIIECKISHWQKERLVDLIFAKIYPSLNKMRETKTNAEIVDVSFNKYFPDVEKVIKDL
jgi:hypothetical protein